MNIRKLLSDHVGIDYETEEYNNVVEGEERDLHESEGIYFLSFVGEFPNPITTVSLWEESLQEAINEYETAV